MTLLIVSFIIPITLIILSLYLLKMSRMKINKYSGFRTKNSMKGQKSWYKANKLESKYSFIMGIIALILSILIISLCGISEKISLILTFIQIILLILVSVITQIKLKKSNP